MGWSTELAENLKFEVKRIVRVNGVCPECGTPFQLEAENWCEYGCPCGYFRWYDLSGDEVTVDNHGVRTEEWKRRLRETLASGQLPVGSVWRLARIELSVFPNYYATYDSGQFLQVVVLRHSERTVSDRKYWVRNLPSSVFPHELEFEIYSTYLEPVVD